MSPFKKKKHVYAEITQEENAYFALSASWRSLGQTQASEDILSLHPGHIVVILLLFTMRVVTTILAGFVLRPTGNFKNDADLDLLNFYVTLAMRNYVFALYQI